MALTLYHPLTYGSQQLTKNNDPEKHRNNEGDPIAQVVGDFGVWQLQLSVMMALLKLPNAWHQLNIIFLAPPQEFWCKKPTFLMKFTEEEWRKICSPVVSEYPCWIFDPDILNETPTIDRILIPLVQCHNFTYDHSMFTRTITSDWDLVCSKHYYVHLAQTIMMWGALLGGVVFGATADKFGRKNPLMACIVIQSITNVMSGFMPTFWYFIVNRFILALACGGISIISFVVCMEAVTGKWRTVMPVLTQIPFGFGNAIMAGLSYWLRDWRKLELALGLLTSLFMLYWFWLTESPRWLLATGRTDKAIEVLKLAAAKNNRTVNEDDIRDIMAAKAKTSQRISFIAFLRTKNMRLNTVLLTIIWFCTGLAFYTFSQYLGTIGSNIFATVAIIGLISSMGPIVCIFITAKAGRKTTVRIFQFITGTCFVLLLMIPRNYFSHDWPRVLSAGVGMAGMSGSLPALYLLSAEIYPTMGRNVGVGGVCVFARIGSMIAPVFVNLDHIMNNLTLILLAIMSFAQVPLLAPLPETKDCILPDTLEEAESFRGGDMIVCRVASETTGPISKILLPLEDYTIPDEHTLL